MLVNEIYSYSFEKPALYLLSLLLGKPNDISELTVPSDFGLLRFKGMDLLQERGQIPKLVLDFELEGGSLRTVYFGHVSPFKLGNVQLIQEGRAEINHVFSDAGKVMIPMQAATEIAGIPAGLNWNIVAGSLSLWRACCGLPNGCEPSLGKYFNKMKTVSRYQWENISYELKGDEIVEEWTACVTDAVVHGARVVFVIKNGLISVLRD
ncbi:hypothetical protein [Maridesulfovibrio sp.]|uniref:hypothetical protein n=1 Tax=Maridesulfovibrio sp. TaxID=2795000 RepID=UPI002A18B71F|nr:hypothetical protein [Maridesulfovibrio sp.]